MKDTFWGYKLIFENVTSDLNILGLISKLPYVTLVQFLVQNLPALNRYNRVQLNSTNSEHSVYISLTLKILKDIFFLALGFIEN